MNQIDLVGRKAIVTGAGRGIGRAIAERLLRSGAAAELWDMDEGRLAEAARTLRELGEVASAVVDVTDTARVDAAAAAAAERWGRIDILVNNAGILGPIKPSWEHTDEEWQKVVDILLTGVFKCSRAVVGGMIERGYGRVVNIASASGKEGSPGMPAYSAAKGGVMALTKTMGRDLAQLGVLVNCITPATIETEMVRQQSTPEMRAYGLARIPMGRFGEVDEIAALAAWLCSEDCSFSTCGVFDASGGRSTY